MNVTYYGDGSVKVTVEDLSFVFGNTFGRQDYSRVEVVNDIVDKSLVIPLETLTRIVKFLNDFKKLKEDQNEGSKK